MLQPNSFRLTPLKLALILCICGTFFVAYITDRNRIPFQNNIRENFRFLKTEIFPLNHTQRSLEPIYQYRLLSNKSEVDCEVVECIDVLLIFTRVYEISGLKQKFSTCIASIFTHTTTPLRLHIITDNGSLSSSKKIFEEVSFSANTDIQISFYNVENVVEPIKGLVSYMKPHFSYKPGAYYSDALFFLSIAIHQVFPQNRLIMTDIDVQFFDDIKFLNYHFDNFGREAVIGLAWEQQPVYLHLVHDYRRNHPDTRAGSPPPNGLPGFNSGILLLDLKKMRESALYNSAINETTVELLTAKYKFKGHLGDQDLFTLLSFEYEELFYVLPCGWNRQLCQWWKHHGYEDVFQQYSRCKEKICVYHGNCNTPIPEENS